MLGQDKDCGARENTQNWLLLLVRVVVDAKYDAQFINFDSRWLDKIEAGVNHGV